MSFANANCGFRSLAMGVGVLCCAWMGRMEAAAPTGILLSPDVAPENSPPNTLVGVLTAVDPDVGDEHVFSFAEGEGDTYNYGFLISGNELSMLYGVGHDFESGPLSLSLRLRVTDLALESYEEILIIEVTDDRTEDADGDGLSEEDEEDVHGTSDVVFDTDGDGVGDGTEVMAGTSPTDGTDWPETSIVAWGNTSNRERASPPGAEYVEMASGQTHSLALTSAGVVNAWGGWDSYGQATVPGGLTGVLGIAAGGEYWFEDSSHSLVLKSDGTVEAWGYSYDGSMTVPEALDTVVAVSAGRSHGLALKSDGTVVAWGQNPFGVVAAPAGLSGVVAVSAGGFRSLALKGDGTVVAWGHNFDGVEWVDARVPVGLNEVVAVAAGRFHNLALKSDGTVVAWGYNLDGQTDVPVGLAGVVAVAAGGFHSLALKNDGSVVAWGSDSHGQVTVPASSQTGVKRITAGILHSLAIARSEGFPEITSTAVVDAMPGLSFSHQIAVVEAVPVSYSAIGLPAGLSLDSATGLISGTMAAAARVAVRIRVLADTGVLEQILWLRISEGGAPTAVTLTPAQFVENSPVGMVVGVLGAVDPDTGDSHSYELVDGEGADDNGSFRIDGSQVVVDQDAGRDFEQNAADMSIRVRARDASLNFCEQVLWLSLLDDRNEDADGDGLSEADEEDLYQTSDVLYDSDGDGFGDGFEITHGSLPDDGASVPDGALWMAWGDNDSGQTGFPGAMGDLLSLSAGADHCLAVGLDGLLIAWGGNLDGQTTVPAGLQDVVAVAAGIRHSMALLDDGTLVAWGNNDEGQTDVPVGLAGVVEVSAGGFHNLALRDDGTVVAWGNDSYGQVAVPVGLADVVAVSAGAFHSLALKSDGTVIAWGWDSDGITTVPAGLSGVIGISAGGYHSLALRHDGTVEAWGLNDSGQSVVPDGLVNVREISAGFTHNLVLLDSADLVSWGAGMEQEKVPLEAHHIGMIEAGDAFNLVLRKEGGIAGFADVSPVLGWPGETVSVVVGIQNAIPSGFSAMGLPIDLTLDPVTGLLSGLVTGLGDRRSVRCMVESDAGPMHRVLWVNTADGVAPTDLSLVFAGLVENSPAGTVVGSLSAVDPNGGDTQTFDLDYVADAPDSFRFVVSGDQLLLRYDLATDFEAGITDLLIRMIATDSGGNTFEQDFVLPFTDDRLEDADGDGVDEMTEEDVFGTSDVVYDDFTTADGDLDGVPGMLEHAFNLDPLTPGLSSQLVPGEGDLSGLPGMEMVADGSGGEFLRIEYLRRIGGGLTYLPEFSSSLTDEDWEPAGGEITVLPIDDTWERCIVEDTESATVVPRRFGRVRVLW